MSKDRLKATMELQDAMTVGDVEQACLLSAHFTHKYGVGAVQDVLIQHVIGLPTRTVQLVAFFANRVTMCSHVRYRKDIASLRRLICEVVATITNYNRSQHITHVSVQKADLDTTKLSKIVNKYCTKEAQLVIEQLIKSDDDPNKSVDELVAIKNYVIEVPVPCISIPMSRDPLWVVWKIVTEAYSYDKILEKYVNDLFVIYKTRYRRQMRKDAAVMLKDIFLAIQTKKVPCGPNVYTNVAIEAAWKIKYVYDQLDEKGKQPAQTDIICNMLC